MATAPTATVAFRLPDLGEGVVKTEIVRWLVDVGDVLVEDQPMVEVMTDKATVEIPAPAAGTVSALHAAAGEVVAVGSTICEISGVDAAVAGTVGASARAATMGDAPAVAGSAGAAPAGNGGGAGGATPGAASAGSAGARPAGGKVSATPLVRRLAAELGVDLATLTGSGPGGRLVEADVRAAATGGVSGPVATPAPSAAGTNATAATADLATAAGAATTPPGITGVPVTAVTAPIASRVPLRNLRRAIAETLTAAQAVPTVTVVEEADLSDLAVARKGGASWVAYTVRAVVAAIGAEPGFNATLDAAAAEVRLHDRIDVGIAVQTDGGLVVPVLRDAGSLTVAEIDAEVARLGEGAKAGTLGAADLRGSTITVTCAGKLGGLFTTPLLNVPEVAIVGLHRAGERAVVRDGEIVVRTMANLSVSFDHRANDGLDASRFLLAAIADLESGRP